LDSYLCRCSEKHLHEHLQAPAKKGTYIDFWGLQKINNDNFGYEIYEKN